MASVLWGLDNVVINNPPGAPLRAAVTASTADGKAAGATRVSVWRGVSAGIRASLRRTGRKTATRLSAALGADFASIQAVPLLSGADLLITNSIGGVLAVEGGTMAALGSDDFRCF